MQVLKFFEVFGEKITTQITRTTSTHVQNAILFELMQSHSEVKRIVEKALSRHRKEQTLQLVNARPTVTTFFIGAAFILSVRTDGRVACTVTTRAFLLRDTRSSCVRWGGMSKQSQSDSLERAACPYIITVCTCMCVSLCVCM